MYTTDNMGITGFSGRRFGMLIKSDWLINKGTYLKLGIVTIGLFMALSLLISIDAMDELNKIEIVKTEQNFELPGMRYSVDKFSEQQVIIERQMIYMGPLLALGFWLFGLGMTVFGSLTFNCLNSKRHRINTFLIPASTSEKFFLRMLIYLVGGTLLLIVGYASAILIAQFTFGGGKAFLAMARDAMEFNFMGYIIAIFAFLILLGNSIYTLGSSLWPKNSWLKTWIVIMVVQWICGIILISGLLSGMHFDMIIDWVRESGMRVEFGLWCIIITLLVLNLICWVFAWKRFSTTQIVQKFMRK